MSSLRVPRREFARLVTTLFCGHSDPDRESYTRLLSSISGAPVDAIEAVICGDAVLPQTMLAGLRDAIERRLDSDAGREACERFRLKPELLKAEVLGPPSGWPEGIAARLNLAAARRQEEGKQPSRKAGSKKTRPSSKARSGVPDP